MSQPSQNQAEIEDLVSEIAFQKVLLSSIDDTVRDREAAELEVRDEIHALERKLKTLRRSTGTTTTASSSTHSLPPSQQSREASLYTLPQRGGYLGTITDVGSNIGGMEGLRNSEWHTPMSTPSTASTPNSASSLGDLLSPSKMNLPTRKRTHSKTDSGGLAPYGGNKSRRTSPSPFPTGPTTPSTSSGDDEFSIDDIYMKQVKEIEEKGRRQKLDEAYARSIQNGQPNVSTELHHMPGPSAFDRMYGARQPQASGVTGSSISNGYTAGHSSGRVLPWTNAQNRSMLVKPEPSMMTSSVKREPSHSATGLSSYDSAMNNIASSKVKNEATSARPMPGGFQELSEDSDSDLEIIPPSAFKDNGRHSHASTSNRGWGLPSNSQRVEEPATNMALQIAMYGNQPIPSWMDTASPTMNFGTLPPPFGSQTEVPYQANNGYVYPSVYTNNSYIANGSGGMYTNESGLGHTMNNLPAYGMSVAHPPRSFAGPSQAFGSMSQSFANHDPLADIIRRSGGNNYDELQEYLNLGPSMNDQLDYIMNDPRKNADEIKNLLENIKPDVDLPPENREGTPEGLVYPLYEHQKIALTWLKAMEEGTNKGGILADDMGLGKTISSLALLLSRPSTDRLLKTTLIVGPVALIRQWDREIKQKVKAGHRLATHMVHGQSRRLSWPELQVYDVVLTTYGTLAAEYGRLSVFSDRNKGNPHYDQALMVKDFPLLGPKSRFYRVILDEAQCIKNKSTKTARATCALKATYRFCLTGTPMMNNVEELYSLIHFLRIKPYNDWTRFRTDFSAITKGSRDQWSKDNALRKLQAVLKAILLRRTKTSLIDGKPIITLPKKTEEIQHVIFDEEQQAFYNALEQKMQIQFNRYVRAGTVTRHYANILVLLLRLRQACCHPHLIHDFEEAPGGPSSDAMLDLAKSLSEDVVARILAADDAFTCPICYDAAPNPSFIIPCGHDTCAECLTKIADQAAQQNVANGNEGRGSSTCPACRGNLQLDKVIDYITFKKVYKPSPEDEAAEDESETDSDDDSDTDSDVDSEDDVDSGGDLRGFIVPDDIEDEIETADEAEGEDVKNSGNGDDKAEETPRNPNLLPKAKSKGKGKKVKGRGKTRDGKKEKKEKISMAMLKKEASKNKEAHRRYMKYLRKHWQPSAKVTKCVELLEQFHNDGHKTIIFSQFVSLLDLLQVPIEDNKWKCLRYDGSMSADARNDAINSFTDKPNQNIMLISLKAGNAGLNLTAASRVIILDPFWNPFIEMQAVDRAYRIGQQKEVEVHRILIENTVEDRIIELQEKKRALVEAALDEGANKSIGRLGERELAFLFGVGGR